MKKLYILLLVLTVSLSAQQVTQVFKRFTAQTATGRTSSFQFAQGQNSPSDQYTVTNGFVPKDYTIEITPTGSPTTCTYVVRGTLKLTNELPANADFTGGELTSTLDCTSTVKVHVTNKPYVSLQGELLSISGGTSPTVQLSILAK